MCGVNLSQVDDTGDFIRVTLLDVPQYLSNSALERDFSQYGNIVNIMREHIQYDGTKIENETRWDDATVALDITPEELIYIMLRSSPVMDVL